MDATGRPMRGPNPSSGWGWGPGETPGWLGISQRRWEEKQQSRWEVYSQVGGGGTASSRAQRPGWHAVGYAVTQWLRKQEGAIWHLPWESEGRSRAPAQQPRPITGSLSLASERTLPTGQRWASALGLPPRNQVRGKELSNKHSFTQGRQ